MILNERFATEHKMEADLSLKHSRLGGKGMVRRMVINGVGAVATGITLVVLLVAKFTEGAWITAILVPVLIVTICAVKRAITIVSHARSPSIAPCASKTSSSLWSSSRGMVWT